MMLISSIIDDINKATYWACQVPANKKMQQRVKKRGQFIFVFLLCSVHRVERLLSTVIQGSNPTPSAIFIIITSST